MIYYEGGDRHWTRQQWYASSDIAIDRIIGMKTVFVLILVQIFMDVVLVA